ncbi:hypothetical protein [Brevibacillus panacihumi]|nr:hypothetical protein [Brevibacillus panacihumi]
MNRSQETCHEAMHDRPTRMGMMWSTAAAKSKALVKRLCLGMSPST